MDYMQWLNIKATVIDLIEKILKVILWIVILILKIIRFGIFLISSIGYYIFSLFFIFGMYFCFTVVTEMMNGVAFSNTTNKISFVMFFIVPLVFGVIKELTKG